ncbi:biosynthetic arginine decarboxylase [Pelagicoccus sp. SDUM812003]|uniref:biosynthetic arginine decarboxylase n=1 Tax=Pelagicoccus sp. SDUM812003 TaxID=3041267 RepID=UPI002810635D|nr:biosynthetic arginine decarboxylase [Pelagicoccus sp. SDUM812003]MDQ8203064.1 biosynthetic arginine decarboxylase [Pelagicoccus sp. SDUM812003]
MSSNAKSRWTISEAERLYGFNRWGSPYYSVDKEGYVCAHPAADERTVRIDDVIKEAATKGIKAPMVIRFQDLLRHRVERLNEAFAKAIEEEEYAGKYRGVFPIKVNQLREVIEEIQDAGKDYGYGLEAGSKPELLIAMAMHQSSTGLLICNGYKDEDYIRLALHYRRIGKDIIIVVEQLSEVEKVIEISQELGVEALVGLRAKLGTRGEGKWAMSTGDNAKFGLTPTEMLEACRLLERAKMQSSLRLLHFHIGSQVPNIITLKNAVVEATRYYCQLQKLGFPMGYLDVGGGLGIDYDGSRSNYESSANYSLEEYARDVVYNVKQICSAMEVDSPDIVSESGRAIAAPHSILITEVFGRISKRESLLTVKKDEIKDQVVADLHEMLHGRVRYGQLEMYHDALQKKEEADSLFNHGYLDLRGRAQADSLFWQICNRLEKKTQTTRGYQPEELIGLSEILADQYVCNFSVFQSLLDHWALDQLFPITPLARLKERPSVNAILVDITCDSDGKVSKFIDLEDEKEYLPLHPLKKNEPYYLGIYLVGAYQDIMGDNHNLFGRVNEVHVFLDEDEEDGFYIEDTIQGYRMKDVLEGVQYRAEGLCQQMKKQIDRATKKDLVKPRDGVHFMEIYEAQIQQKSYLAIDYKRKRRTAAKRAKKP